MKKTIAQALLSIAIVRSGLTEAQIAGVLGVTQSTVSRLKNGKIAKVSRYQQKLDDYFGHEPMVHQNEFSELMALAQSSPALREALIALQRLMREYA